ncbi:hypothetical protein PVAP13_9KG573150 [Panicum virgatum]|uniref:Uncharacterized protein n=1 Tax=Panicum virgatum TaxID=38727 RepID=A0A8T0P444_PANVG|nr:hypothetical protein PVAP13_9KG573150 [Panicum virgatum]
MPSPPLPSWPSRRDCSDQRWCRCPEPGLECLKRRGHIFNAFSHERFLLSICCVGC